MTQVISATGMPSQTTTATVSQCDLTEAQAKQVEQSGTNTATTTMEGLTATMKSTTTCRKK